MYVNVWEAGKPDDPPPSSSSSQYNCVLDWGTKTPPSCICKGKKARNFSGGMFAFENPSLNPYSSLLIS